MHTSVGGARGRGSAAIGSGKGTPPAYVPVTLRARPDKVLLSLSVRDTTEVPELCGPVCSGALPVPVRERLLAVTVRAGGLAMLLLLVFCWASVPARARVLVVMVRAGGLTERTVDAASAVAAATASLFHVGSDWRSEREP